MLKSDAVPGWTELERAMRVSLSRPRVIAAASMGLVVVALTLGILLPPKPSSGASKALAAGSPQLLISAYADDASTLWLVDPDDTQVRQQLFPVSHAAGWALDGAVSPAGDRLALLVVPPGGSDPSTDTQLLISDGGEPRLLAGGLDLRGGLAWSGDGSFLLVRRTTSGDGALDETGQADSRRPVSALIEVSADDGRTRVLAQRSDAGGLYPVGRPIGGATYAVAVGAGGSTLLTIDATVRERPLSPVVTRGWSLSPDGGALAYTEQRGLALQVRVARLDDLMLLEPAGLTPAGLESAGLEAAGSGTATIDDWSASPVWRPDGDLSIGGAGGSPAVAGVVEAGAPASDGFVLPVAWSAGGAYLALRSFDGRGPGNAGLEQAAVRGADGETQSVQGEHVRILGWWNAAD